MPFQKAGEGFAGRLAALTGVEDLTRPHSERLFHGLDTETDL